MWKRVPIAIVAFVLCVAAHASGAAAPFQPGPQYGLFTAPSTFTSIPGQTENSLGWTEQSPNGTAVLTVRHDPTLFTSIADFGAEQAGLAASHAVALDGFRNYELLENHAQAACAGDTTERWYTKIRGDYYGTQAVAEQMFFIRDGTLYSAGYLRPLNVPEDPLAPAAVQRLCPRPATGPKTGSVVNAGTVGGIATLVVNSVPLTAQDTMDLYGLIIRSASLQTKPVAKNSAEMPAYAPDITYAGKDAGGRSVLWATRTFDTDLGRTNGPERAKMYREWLAAALAAGLDQDQGSATLQSFVHQRTPAALMTLALAFLDAIQRADSETIANSQATQDWIAAHIKRGMTRDAVASSFSAKNIASKSLVRQSANCNSDMVGHWWYQGNYPYTECAFVSPAHPVISVTLQWHSEPGCSFSSFLDVLFDSNDRVQRLGLSNPIPNCL